MGSESGEVAGSDNKDTAQQTLAASQALCVLRLHLSYFSQSSPGRTGN